MTASTRTPKPSDRCHTCGRKVVQGVVACVHCRSTALYGPWHGTVHAAPPIRRTWPAPGEGPQRDEGGHSRQPYEAGL
jgi:hypothetical protein